MTTAYVDTSWIAAIALREDRFERLETTLTRYDELFSSNLLEAELCSVLYRERVTVDPVELLERMTWIYTTRSVGAEIRTVLEIDYLRGADLWHLANALFIAPNRGIDFLTLDTRQRDVSRRLGFGPA